MTDALRGVLFSAVCTSSELCVRESALLGNCGVWRPGIGTSRELWSLASEKWLFSAPGEKGGQVGALERRPFGARVRETALLGAPRRVRRPGRGPEPPRCPFSRTGIRPIAEKRRIPEPWRLASAKWRFSENRWVCAGASRGARRSLACDQNSRLRLCHDSRNILPCVAGLAQLVARNLAKVEVAGSNPVARSRNSRGRSVTGPFCYS